MSIYRGPGGAGDATNDASSQAVIAIQKANEATVSAANAASSATAAANSATAAANSASAASTAETNAETAQTAAETARDATINFADDLQVDVNTLSAGSSATVTYNSATPIITFGIPRGDAGTTGSTGAAGDAATISIGTVTTGAAGSSASITNTGTSSAAVFDFAIPRGDTGSTGSTGSAATVAVGTTTTGVAGTSASVTNSGTSSAATFNFTIPRGDTGATGAVGAGTPAGGTAGQILVKNSSTDYDTSFSSSITAPTSFDVNSSSTALRITQTGAGNAILVEDSANPDSSPFVVDASGFVIAGYTANIDSAQIQTFNGSQTNFRWNAASTGPSSSFKKSRSATIGSYSIVGGADTLGTLRWYGDDGTAFIEAASISANVDGTPGTNDMPGRLVFSTTADGSNAPTERMRIKSDGTVGIATTSTGGFSGTVNLGGGGAPTSGHLEGWMNSQNIPSSVTTRFDAFMTAPTTATASFTLSNLVHYRAQQGSFGAGSAVTNQYGFYVDATLTSATNNYAFSGNIASGTGRYNLFMQGTADNYMAGNVGIGTTSTGTYKLNVTGNTNITGDLTVSGTINGGTF